MPLLFEDDVWSGLGDVSLPNKALYLLMWSKADRIGVFRWNLSEVRGLAGYDFHTTDLNALGDRVVSLGGGEFLLSRYLKTTVGRLSRRSTGHNRVWEMIHDRWGGPDEVGNEPFYAVWEDLGIRKHAPEVIEEYHGEAEGLPKFLAEHRALAREAEKAAVAPASWPVDIQHDFAYYCNFRLEFALRVISVDGCREWSWGPNDVTALIRTVNSWFHRKAMPSEISQALFSSAGGKYKNIRIPPSILRKEHQDAQRRSK